MRTFVALAAAASLALWGACNIQDEENHDPEDDDASASASSTSTAGTGVGGTGTGPSSSGSGATGAASGSGGGGGAGTPPEVLCGAETCDPQAEVCCVRGDAASCELPRDCIDGPEGAVTAKLLCDDSLDCDGGVCCLELEAPIVEVYACQPAGTTCQQHEACVPGDETCQPSFTCVFDEGFTGGKCAHDAAEVPCGTNLTCQDATPVCCWDANTTTGTCITHGADCSRPLECDAATDCGPNYRCCSNGTLATCAGQCPTNVLCDQNAECPSNICTPEDAPTFPQGFTTCE